MQNDLKFSGNNPVTINYHGSVEDIYAPVRTSSADVNIVSSQILDDLYTARKDEICVRIKRGNTTIWEGYKQPNTYSQEVSQNLDEIEMTCIDPVSILKFVTIDKILERPMILTYGQLIGKALAYVKLDADTLCVERVTSYNGTYSGSNGLLDLSCQVSNFWDESDKPSTVYEVIEELLRPFCLTLVYYHNSYQIYSVNKISGSRKFDKYTINANGSLTLYSSNVNEDRTTGLYLFSDDDWKSNNTSTPTIEINSTYDKVIGTASTMVPEYNKMAVDLIDLRDLPSEGYEDLNVQRNKTKGYVWDLRVITPAPGRTHTTPVIDPVTEDRWFYLWNGVYTNTDYELRDNGLYQLWYNNCNKAYYYLTGNEGHPYNWGSCLNFYGGNDNMTATGKSQSVEKPVKIEKRITAYAPDNGVPLEFLETSDLAWNFLKDNGTPVLQKVSPDSSKFGTGISSTTVRKIYHQAYDNICLSLVDDQTIDIDLTQAYSRTGINVPVDVLSNNTTTNKTYSGSGTSRVLSTCNTDYFPPDWNAKNVVVNSFYWRRNTSGSGTGAEAANASCLPLWDERRIDIYIKLSDGTYKQFNGVEWVTDDGNHNHSIWLTKMITGQNLYHNDMRYDMIRTSTNSASSYPIRYYLGDEDKKIYLDNDGGVTENETDDYILARSYKKEDSAWYSWVEDCSEGSLSIKLPYMQEVSVTVYVDVYSSNILGMTGLDSYVTGYAADHTFPFYYTLSDTVETTSDFKKYDTYANFLPANVSYVKAEHLDLKIEVSVPESNLGQVFSQSDIEYEINSNQNYVEEFSGPSFRVNTFNSLVASSFSYLIYNNSLADPTLFKMYSLTVRPECYTVQAYFNWLNKIRKIYTKTLVPEMNRTRPFANVRCYLKSPEVGTNELLVIKDTWDIKTNRHTVTAIEDHNMEVSSIGAVDILEIPRKARAERWNLPTANKN